MLVPFNFIYFLNHVADVGYDINVNVPGDRFTKGCKCYE